MSNIKLTDLTELLSADTANTILYAADLSVSPNVSHYLRVGSISSLTDYSIANAAFLRANTAFSVGYNANLALSVATTANTLAVAAVKRDGDTITGTVNAPTAPVDTNTTQLATTAYVVNQGYIKVTTAFSNFANIASPTFTGYPKAPTLPASVSNTSIATTAYVKSQGYITTANAALLYQPLLTYTPVQQGGGSGQGSNKLYLGWGGSTLFLQVDTTNFGANWPINITGRVANTSTNAFGSRTVQPISAGVPINSIGIDGDIIYQY